MDLMIRNPATIAIDLGENIGAPIGVG